MRFVPSQLSRQVGAGRTEVPGPASGADPATWTSERWMFVLGGVGLAAVGLGVWWIRRRR